MGKPSSGKACCDLHFKGAKLDRIRSKWNMSGTEIIFSVQELPEGRFVARALDHSIFTQADSLDELKTNIRHAKQSVIRLPE